MSAKKSADKYYIHVEFKDNCFLKYGRISDTCSVPAQMNPLNSL